MSVVIASNKPEEWAKFSEAGIDFIPDPMVLRTAELFFNGRQGCMRLGIDSEAVWKSIQLNLDALLAFFDILMTREKIPLIQYWLTFESPDKSLKELLDSMVTPVTVDYMLYADIKGNAMQNLRNIDFKRLPTAMFKDITQELGSYGHEWRPEVDLDIPETWKRTAEFLLGGFIFSGYAQASQNDHIIQSKRSRLYTELLVPEDEETRWGYQKEKELFAAFAQYCGARGNTTVNEFNFAPNILPILLKQYADKGGSPLHLLEEALLFRENRIGESYRTWFQKLRRAWELGENNTAAKREVLQVQTELEQKLQDKPKNGERIVKAEVEASVTKVLSFKLSKDISFAAINQWIRGWYMKNLPINQHRKFMYRMYLAEADYARLDKALKTLWWNN
ncbi:hypothetical protein [Spongiimicrobium sp. 2-473A-2-J]|uniref:hypothetical protein n=1 Tax=Eudoraea algarum TaxID=3417568 RepID=UPI003D367EFB